MQTAAWKLDLVEWQESVSVQVKPNHCLIHVVCFVQTFWQVFGQMSADDIHLDVCKNKLQKGEKSTSRKGM